MVIIFWTTKDYAWINQQRNNFIYAKFVQEQILPFQLTILKQDLSISNCTLISLLTKIHHSNTNKSDQQKIKYSLFVFVCVHMVLCEPVQGPVPLANFHEFRCFLSLFGTGILSFEMFLVPYFFGPQSIFAFLLLPLIFHLWPAGCSLDVVVFLMSRLP